MPWLSDVFEIFKRLLDEESVRMKSPQAIRQTLVRKIGNESSRLTKINIHPVHLVIASQLTAERN